MADLRTVAAAVEAEKRGVLQPERRAALNELRRRAAGSQKSLSGYLEPILSIGSAALAEPVSGFVGLAGLPFGSEAAANAVRRTQEAMTYQPRTEQGQRNLQAVGEALAPVGEAIEGGSRFLGDKTLEATGSPGLAAAAYSLPTAAMEAVGLKGANVAGKAGKLGKQFEMGDIQGQAFGQRGAVAGAGDDVVSAIRERPDAIILDKVVVPEESRGTGVGSQFMRDLIERADSEGKRVELSPSSDFGGNKKRLTEFYKRFGFVENKGKNKDFEISESMYRLPK